MKIVNNLDLTPYNSYGIKSVCKRAFFPDTEEEIQEIFTRYAEGKKIIIGGGYNIILSNEFYEDDFVIFSGNFGKVVLDNEFITAESGVSMFDLSNIALQASLSGLELFYDIPSSLGGAVVMNAGASGEEIKDLLVKVRYYDPVLNIFTDILRDDISFEYRNSFFQRNPHLIIIKTVLKLNQGNAEAIFEKMESNKAMRWAKQPKDFPNAGSVFKRPKGYYVGAMMDELGLKGFSVGGAKISEKHGGFIVNFNNASGRDILDLIAIVKQRIFSKYGIDIEVEQRII
ncbi:UDP-N-acetylmuramate dehydrogenase [Pedobacter sp. MC2016-14]|uniref:UDP-N-acetylmuramate dehydrogenase n=1 Tax=Pedobacter sp. MC2016-14 TaxID=2897327 RepID=UPI001E600938|nr:UDP-N-acetylmuramate dehydrogenase [Pedobacter sp. MC2016-14]MCD0486868.1 UDP-N-acetylmuramate dehydrogenase [Pedobacter sp. MC2016-14]